MSIEEAQAKVEAVLRGDVTEAETRRAAAGVALHYETLGWSGDQYRAEILRLRLLVAEYEDFDV